MNAKLRRFLGEPQVVEQKQFARKGPTGEEAPVEASEIPEGKKARVPKKPRKNSKSAALKGQKPKEAGK